eukprot:5341338-Heterocapsa_arctica.AAC.1
MPEIWSLPRESAARDCPSFSRQSPVAVAPRLWRCGLLARDIPPELMPGVRSWWQYVEGPRSQSN